MNAVLGSVAALLVSATILLMGHGLQLAVAPLYADALGWTPAWIGYIGSGYFAGFVLGCLTVPALVARVGHIRVFSVLVAGATVALLLLDLVQTLTVWMIARVATGWCLSGLYMVIESWLNERTTPDKRARILSIYTIITLLAIGGGQLLIGVGLEYSRLIILGAMLFALGTIPVGLTTSPAPEPIPAVSFKLRAVYRGARVAVVGAFVGGLVTSGFWALGPIVARAQGLAPDQIGLFLAVTLLGGVVFQYPLGRFSDRVDRRVVIAFVAALGVGVCLLSLLADYFEAVWFVYLLMFLFGGVTFPLYSLCLAHANDNSDLPLMEIASVVLMMQSAGSVIGPLLVSALLSFNDGGLFIVAGSVLAVFGTWTVGRMRIHAVMRRHFSPFIALPRTTHSVAEGLEQERPEAA